MKWVNQAADAFKDNDLRYVAYLPDSAIWPLIEAIERDGFFDANLVSREEEAVGLLTGSWLGGRRGALICQTSGLANTFNALAGLSKPWGFPFVGIVSRRGDLGEHNLAQIPGGYNMPRLLDTIGIRNCTLDASRNVGDVVDMAINTAFSVEEPYIVLVEKDVTRGVDG